MISFGALILAVPLASASVIGVEDFVAPTLIDFNTAPSGPIDGYYSGLGVTFSHLDGGDVYNAGTGAGASPTATNFYTEPGYPHGMASFSSSIARVGVFNLSASPTADTMAVEAG